MDGYGADNDHYDYFFKVILAGDTGVGKSSLFSKLTKNEFSFDYRSTIAIESVCWSLDMDGKIIKTQICDAAGGERDPSVISAFYAKAVCAMVVYDVTRRSTFRNIGKWLSKLKEYNTDKNFVIMLIGNKSDLRNLVGVSTKEGKSFAEKRSLDFMETSALESSNVHNAFLHLLTEIYYRKTLETSNDAVPLSVQALESQRNDKSWGHHEKQVGRGHLRRGVMEDFVKSLGQFMRQLMKGKAQVLAEAIDMEYTKKYVNDGTNSLVNDGKLLSYEINLENKTSTSRKDQNDDLLTDSSLLIGQSDGLTINEAKAPLTTGGQCTTDNDDSSSKDEMLTSRIDQDDCSTSKGISQDSSTVFGIGGIGSTSIHMEQPKTKLNYGSMSETTNNDYSTTTTTTTNIVNQVKKEVQPEEANPPQYVRQTENIILILSRRKLVLRERISASDQCDDEHTLAIRESSDIVRKEKEMSTKLQLEGDGVDLERVLLDRKYKLAGEVSPSSSLTFNIPLISFVLWRRRLRPERKHWCR